MINVKKISFTKELQCIILVQVFVVVFCAEFSDLLARFELFYGENEHFGLETYLIYFSQTKVGFFAH